MARLGPDGVVRRTVGTDGVSYAIDGASEGAST
jgi:hypothetical protein